MLTIRTIQKIQDWEKNPLVMRALFRCHSNNEDPESALQALNAYTGPQPNKEILLLYATVYLELKDPEKAREYLHQIPGYKTDKDALIKKIHILTAEQKFEEAIVLLNKIPTVNDKQKILAHANIERKRRNPSEAIKILQSYPAWEYDRTILLILGRCFSYNHQYEEALQTFKRIGNWREEQSVVLGMAAVYSRMGKNTEAISLIKTLPYYNQNVRLSTEIACYYIRDRQIETGLNYLDQKIKDWASNLFVMTQIARYYEYVGEVKEAMANIKKIRGWQNDLRLCNYLRLLENRYKDLEQETDPIPALTKQEKSSDRQSLMLQAREYEANKEPQKAISCYKQIRDWNTDLQALRGIAHATEQISIEEAIKLFEVLPFNDYRTALSLGRCYQNAGKYTEALETFKQFQGYESMPEFLLAIAICESTSGDHEAGLETLQKIPNWEKNEKAMLAVLRIYEALHDFVNAERILNKWLSIDNLKGEAEKIATIAFYYYKRGDYGLALNKFREYKYWATTPKFVYGMTNIYEDLGEYQKGIDLLTILLTYIKTKQKKNNNTLFTIAIALSKLYCKLRRYERAIDALKEYPEWQSEKQILANLIRIYLENGTASKAEEVLASINDLKNDNSMLLSLGSIYAQHQDTDRAIKFFKQISNWQEDEKAVLAIAFCHQKKGLDADAVILLKQFPNWQKNKRICLSLAVHLSALGRHDDAEACLKEFRQDKQVLLALGHIYGDKGEEYKAIETFQRISNYFHDLNAVLAIAAIYEKLKEFQKALELFSHNPSWQHNRKVLLHIACNYSKQSLHRKAIDQLKKIPFLDFDQEALIMLATCYHLQELYQDAINTITRTPHYKTTRATISLLSNIYLETERYELAFPLLQELKDKFPNNKTLMNLSFCYAKINHFKKALEIIDQIQNWQNQKKVVLHRVWLLEEAGEYQEALGLLNLLPEPHDKQILIRRGLMHEKLRENTEASKIFESSPNWKTDKEILLVYGRFLQKTEQFITAINLFKSIPEWESDLQAQMALACCYDQMENFKPAKLLHEKLRKEYPDNCDIAFHYCAHLVATDDEKALPELENALKKWPYRIRLHTCQVDYFHQKGEMDNAQKKLVTLQQQFSSHREITFKLIEHHFLAGNHELAKKTADDLHKRYPNNLLLERKINYLLKIGPDLQWYVSPIQRARLIDVQEEEQLIDIPELFYNIINDLHEQLSTDIYPVGGCVRQWLKGETTCADLDIFGRITKEQISQLSTLGFAEDFYKPNLYTRKATKTTPAIDFYVYVAEPNDSGWLRKDALRRDFTVTSLICKLLPSSDGKMQGRIIDRLSGLADFRHGCLRIIGDPLIRLLEDPILSVRIVYNELHGYKPTEDLLNVLKEWNLPESYNKSNLFAVTRKELNHVKDKEQYVKKLQEYGLLKKLFDCEPTVAALWDVIAPPQVNNRYRIFSAPLEDMQPKATTTLFNQMIEAITNPFFNFFWPTPDYEDEETFTSEKGNI